MPDIWAIILAAGESKRMNSPKMLLPFGRSTIIERVIENVAASDLDNTLVVLGSSGDEILKRIESTSVKHCFNESYKEGMLSSVKCGFRNLPEKSESADWRITFAGAVPITELMMLFRQRQRK